MPVGRGVAYDQERGRLWVVCPTCGRWNLCPFEERWEVLEECARLSDTALLREATAEVSLLQHRQGLSMIQLGRPSLGELVSWRYARNLVGRRRRFAAAMLVTGATGGLVLGGIAAGWSVAVGLIGTLSSIPALVEIRRGVVDLTSAKGQRLVCTAPMLRGLSFHPGDSNGVTLRVRTRNAGLQEVTGEDAGILLARAMPYINETGGTTDAALSAAQAIHEHGGVERFLQVIAQDRGLHRRSVLRAVLGRPRIEGAIFRFPKPMQLALEAVSHFDQEDRAMSGEMQRTLAEWRSAEAEAEISDRLLEPTGWDEFRRSQLAGGPGEDGV